LVANTHPSLALRTGCLGNTGLWTSLGDVVILNTTLLAACCTPAAGDIDHLTEDDTMTPLGSTTCAE